MKYLNLLFKTFLFTFIFICFSHSMLKAQDGRKNYLSLQPLAIAERHTGFGMGIGYEHIWGKKDNQLGLSIPVIFYHGVFAQIGVPVRPYPDVKSRYLTISPSLHYYPITTDRITYGIGIVLQGMYAYGTAAEGQYNPITEETNYVAKEYAGWVMSALINNQLRTRMGKGNNFFVLNFGLGRKVYSLDEYLKKSSLLKFNLSLGFSIGL